MAAGTAKYDAHHTVLSKTYGALADLRRELSDSKSAVAERTELLNLFADCTDSQRAWLLLEDYFDKLDLSRRDFTAQEWWPRMLVVQGQARLEQLAILFMRSNRPLPTELSGHADVKRFAEIEALEREQQLLQQLETWLFPPAPQHLDGPRAQLHLLCDLRPADASGCLHALRVRFNLFRPRSGERCRSLKELVELPGRAPQDQELFSPLDWEFLRWMADTYQGGTTRTANWCCRAPNFCSGWPAGATPIGWSWSTIPPAWCSKARSPPSLPTWRTVAPSLR